ncbi:MAG TPA: polymer-forming cytoskeletal protein [bacterium]
MFEKKDVAMDEIHTLLGSDAKFEGKLLFEGMVRIDGKFSGEISSSGKLVVGENAKIEGKVEVGALILNGELKGEVTVREKMEISRSGKVDGSVKTPILIIEEGGVFNGNCEMGKTDRNSYSEGK